MKLQLRTTKANKMKNKDLIPGVLYGSGIESTSVSVSALEFVNDYLKYGTSKTFEATLEGKKHIVYIKEVVPVPAMYREYRHFDLIKVSKDDTLTSKVRLVLVNKDVVEKRGLILNTVMDEIEIEYAVGAGVSHIDLDVKDLKENDVLHISDIVTIDGVKILAEPTDTVVTVARPKEEVEVDPDAEEILEVESVKQKDE